MLQGEIHYQNCCGQNEEKQHKKALGEDKIFHVTIVMAERFFVYKETEKRIEGGFK